MIDRLAEILTARGWSHEDIDTLIGHHEHASVGYAAADEVRREAASGGVVTGLLLHLLKTGRADGVLVCLTSVESGSKVRARYHIATTPKEVLAARGSTYVHGSFKREALPLIEQFEGRVAVVALPCEITALTQRADLTAKVPLRISLFCGHTSRPELIDAFTEQLTAEARGELTSFSFRTGAWRGRMRAEFADGTVIEKPSSAYKLYQNLWYFAPGKCLACNNHFGYKADVCAGDLWSHRYKLEPIKHTAIIAKTRRGAAAIESAKGDGALIIRNVPVTEVLDGQRRIAPFHHNVTARHQAGRNLGMSLPDHGQRVRWHERLAARMVLKAFLSTRSIDDARRLLRRPKLLYKARLYVQKGLESLS